MEKKRDLNIGGLEIDEEEIASNKTNRNPNSKSTKTQYSTEETHLKSSLKTKTFPQTKQPQITNFLFHLTKFLKNPFPVSSSCPQITDPPPKYTNIKKKINKINISIL